MFKTKFRETVESGWQWETKSFRMSYDLVKKIRLFTKVKHSGLMTKLEPVSGTKWPDNSGAAIKAGALQSQSQIQDRTGNGRVVRSCKAVF
jgi:hypothetical protein